MKPRAIALGASVIALTLAGGGQAAAGGLGDLSQEVKADSHANTGGPAGSATVDTDVKVPITVPSKGSVKSVSGTADRTSATVEAKRRSGGGDSSVMVNLDGRTRGVSVYADQRRKGALEAEAGAQARPGHANAAVTGFARHAARANVRGDARSGTPSIAKRSRKVSGHGLHTSGAPGKPLPPLQRIGREVGNPIQLSLAGWLIALIGAGSLGVARLVRRLQRAG